MHFKLSTCTTRTVILLVYYQALRNTYYIYTMLFLYFYLSKALTFPAVVWVMIFYTIIYTFIISKYVILSSFYTSTLYYNIMHIGNNYYIEVRLLYWWTLRVINMTAWVIEKCENSCRFGSFNKILCSGSKYDECGWKTGKFHSKCFFIGNSKSFHFSFFFWSLKRDN